jgi:hypothetical protein
MPTKRDHAYARAVRPAYLDEVLPLSGLWNATSPERRGREEERRMNGEAEAVLENKRRTTRTRTTTTTTTTKRRRKRKEKIKAKRRKGLRREDAAARNWVVKAERRGRGGRTRAYEQSGFSLSSR